MFIYWYGAGEEYGTAAAASATASGGLEAGGPPTITPVHPQSPTGDQVTSNSCAQNRPRSDDHGPLDKSTLSKLASKLLIKEDFPEWTKVVFNKPRTKYISSKAIGKFTH